MTEQDPNTNNGHKSLGIAGNMASTFINSPVTPLLMIAVLCIGLLGLNFTPRQEDPKISVPMVDVFVNYPGANADQVTNLVTEPLERIMSEIPGVRHVYSASRRENAIVTVRFLVGEDLGDSIVKVHDKIQSNMDKIPPGVKMPLVKPIGIDDVPTVALTLWSTSLDDIGLRRLGLEVLQRLNEVPNTGKGFIVGGRAEQLRVEVLPERLNGFGISLDEVAATIRTANAERQAGSIESGNTAFNVYTGAFLTGARDISKLVVGVRNGKPIYVGDVARVYHDAAETSNMVGYYSGPAKADGEPDANAEAAVTIAIAKKIGTNGVEVSQAILKKLESLKGNIIPDNVNVAITRDYGKSADDKVNELLGALFDAAFAVAILCLIGLGVRAASVVITVIPIVILITVWSAWVIDYTIDRVSLFALVFSIGILVDDATVVVENIFRRWLEAGKTTVEIAIDAVREVGNPTVLATLTIIAALLPMGVVSGLMGPYMRPIPVLGASAMFFSLLAAFLFTPWLAMRFRPKLKALEKAERREEKVKKLIGKIYNPCMQPLCENKLLGRVFLIGLIAATFLSCFLFYTHAVTVKMLPFDNKPEFNVVINMPEGTALPVTANATAILANELKKIDEVTALQTYVGTASPFNFNGMVRHYFLRKQPWEADIQVMLTDKNDRELSSHDLALDARKRIKMLIDTTPALKNTGIRTQVVEMPPGPPVLQTVVTEIYGPDAETRRQVARDMTAMFERAPGIVDVDNYMPEPYESWRFEVDTEKAVRRGISIDSINRNLAMAMGEYKLGDIKRDVVLEPTYITIQIPLSIRSQINRLKNLPVRSASGQMIPLAELGRFDKVVEDTIIYHKDLRNIEYVVGEMQGELGAPIYGMFDVEDMLENYTTPDGVKITGMPWGLIKPPESDEVSGFEWTGEWTVTYETFRDMGLAFMAALVLIYGLIVWEFKNFVLAGLIMAPIPLTLIGILPGHWIMDAEFTATSMIGFIALAGIIVRNSILIVEFVKIEVAKGRNIQEAAIIAGQTRMRPIFITSLTLIAGSWAIISDYIFQGMAVSLLFGAGIATVLTLIVIPLGCITVAKQFYIITGRSSAEIEEISRESDNNSSGGILASIIGFFTLLMYFIINLLRMILDWISSKLKSNDGPDDTPPAGGSTPATTPPTTPAPASTPNPVTEKQMPAAPAKQNQAMPEQVVAPAPASPTPAAEQKAPAKKKAKTTKKPASKKKKTKAEKAVAAAKAKQPAKVMDPVVEEDDPDLNPENSEDVLQMPAEAEVPAPAENEKAKPTKKSRGRRGIRLKPGINKDK